MRQIALCAGSSPEVMWIDRYDRDGGWDGHLARYTLIICKDPMGVAQIVEVTTQPAERQEVAGRFRQMAGKPSQGDGGEIKYWIESVWEAVEEFPADVIIQACKDINKRDQWRPEPSVVREQCRWVGRKRLALQAMVRRLDQ